MFQAGILVFLSSRNGQYFVHVLQKQEGDTLVLQNNYCLQKQRIMGRGTPEDGLIGTPFSQAVCRKIDPTLERELRVHLPHDPIGASHLFRITEPTLSAARRGEVVLGGVSQASPAARYTRIEPTVISVFDWDFVISEARHLFNSTIYNSVRVFQPDEWKRVVGLRGLIHETPKPTVPRGLPPIEVVIASFEAMFEKWQSGSGRRPKYEVAKADCRAATGASERQLRTAWSQVTENYPRRSIR